MAKLAKIVIAVLNPILHKGGSHFPGHFAIKICPDFLTHIAKPKTIIAITGTSGKTTLSNMVSDVFQHCGYSVTSNTLGSNMEQGIATALLDNATLFNGSRAEIGVLEIDEKSSKRIYSRIKPDYLVCTQFTRDSMMRNAHPYYIFDFVNESLQDGVKMILNADDMISCDLKSENPRVYYSIARQDDDKYKPGMTNDAQVCPKCNALLTYEYTRYGHIGRAHCKNCGYEMPDAQYLMTSINYDEHKLTINCLGHDVEFPMVSDGIFILYDELAAVTLFKEYGLPEDEIKSALERVKVIESRYSTETIDGVEFTSNMTKSLIAPACSAIFDYVANQPKEKEIVMFIEDPHLIDNNAYLYETDFEYFDDELVKKFIIVGNRTHEFYLRLLFAGVPEEKMLMLNSIEEIKDHLDYKRGSAIYLLYDTYQIDTNLRAREIIRKALEGGAAHD